MEECVGREEEEEEEEEVEEEEEERWPIGCSIWESDFPLPRG